MIESTILSPDDLYDLDGETFLRSGDGVIKPGEIDLLQGGDQ